MLSVVAFSTALEAFARSVICEKYLYKRLLLYNVLLKYSNAHDLLDLSLGGCLLGRNYLSDSKEGIEER